MARHIGDGEHVDTVVVLIRFIDLHDSIFCVGILG